MMLLQRVLEGRLLQCGEAVGACLRGCTCLHALAGTRMTHSSFAFTCASAMMKLADMHGDAAAGSKELIASRG